MKTYIVTTREWLLRSFYIEADSPEEAEMEVYDKYIWSDEAPCIDTVSVKEAKT